MKKELHKTELKDAIFQALMSKEIKNFIKLPENYSENYFEDLAFEIAEDYAYKIFDLDEAI